MRWLQCYWLRLRVLSSGKGCNGRLLDVFLPQFSHELCFLPGILIDHRLDVFCILLGSMRSIKRAYCISIDRRLRLDRTLQGRGCS